MSKLLVDMLWCSYLSMCNFDTVISWLFPGSIAGALLDWHGNVGMAMKKVAEEITKKNNPLGPVFFDTGLSPTLIMMLAKLSPTQLASPTIMAKNSELFWPAAKSCSGLLLKQNVDIALKAPILTVDDQGSLGLHLLKYPNFGSRFNGIFFQTTTHSV